MTRRERGRSEDQEQGRTANKGEGGMEKNANSFTLKVTSPNCHSLTLSLIYSWSEVDPLFINLFVRETNQNKWPTLTLHLLSLTHESVEISLEAQWSQTYTPQVLW